MKARNKYFRTFFHGMCIGLIGSTMLIVTSCTNQKTSESGSDDLPASPVADTDAVPPSSDASPAPDASAAPDAANAAPATAPVSSDTPPEVGTPAPDAAMAATPPSTPSGTETPTAIAENTAMSSQPSDKEAAPATPHKKKKRKKHSAPKIQDDLGTQDAAAAQPPMDTPPSQPAPMEAAPAPIATTAMNVEQPSPPPPQPVTPPPPVQVAPPPPPAAAPPPRPIANAQAPTEEEDEPFYMKKSVLGFSVIFVGLLAFLLMRKKAA